ncbi:MAG: hypothetical protein HY270_23990 [Deltaproteobacteria bacterium]|nr:hypothetical protein [Deltaproteobacteria bacterium]
MALLSVFAVAVARPAFHAVHPHHHLPHGMRSTLFCAETGEGRDVERFESTTWQATPPVALPLLLSLSFLVLRTRRRAFRFTPIHRKLLAPRDPAAPSA